MKLTRTAFLIALLGSGVVFAQDVQVVGSIKHSIMVPSHNGKINAQHAVSQNVKSISFLKIQLSQHAQQQMASRLSKAESSTKLFTNTATSSKQVQLGMGDVPVLDQGAHGTCVTFANTAAIDAVLNKGDYVSQLCSLQLGRYLESQAYTPSGWDGSIGPIVLNQLSVFGIVSKAQQKANGCGGMTDYPSNEAALDTDMTPPDYHQLSEPFDANVISWSPIFDMYQVFDDKMNMDEAVKSIKSALDAGDRLTFGVMLPAIGQGMAGAVGKHHAGNDTWVLTPEIIEDAQSASDLPGHEMVITGYDDEAVAIDSNGHKHKGLFTLRNSWGTNLGDKGDFYMSYDYFKALTIETQRIRHITTKS